MATSYSVVVVIAVVLCGLCATGQASGSGGRDNQPNVHHLGPWQVWPDPYRRRREVQTGVDRQEQLVRRRREAQTGEDRQEQLVRYAREIMGNDNAATQKNIFQAIDMDYDGSISLSEWSRADVIDMIDLFCSPPQKQEKEGD